MTIYEHLINKYTESKVQGFLACILMHDVLKYNQFEQWIKLTEYSKLDISSYKADIISKMKNLYSNNEVNEIISILSQYDSCIKKYNTIITYGTFDLFHIGHLNLLKRIKEYGSNLIVGVSTDKFNTLKGKHCIIPYEQRSEIVKSIKYVTKVIPEESWDQKEKDIKQYNVNAFIIGSDWEGKFDYLKKYCDVIYLPRTPNISSTELCSKLSQ